MGTGREVAMLETDKVSHCTDVHLNDSAHTGGKKELARM